MMPGLVDPFVGFNEIKTEWVGTKSWTYRKEFPTPSLRPGAVAVLAFDGLDTFAQVRLNGTTILESDNMFLPHRVDITHALKSADNHVLEIQFEPALLKARELEKQHPKHKWICFNGDSARLAVRKAQYHWGWDWGPVLMCAGIWKPIRLEVYTTRITDVRTDLQLSNDHQKATIAVTASVEVHHQHDLEAQVSIELDGKQVCTERRSVSSDARASVSLEINKPELWWPNGYGNQTLYTVKVSLLRDGSEIHQETRRIGIRTVELVQQPDSHGKSFYFRINGVDIFCGGSCWIPADSFVTNISRERYRAWIELMVPANQKMIRSGCSALFDVC